MCLWFVLNVNTAAPASFTTTRSCKQPFIGVAVRMRIRRELGKYSVCQIRTGSTVLLPEILSHLWM